MKRILKPSNIQRFVEEANQKLEAFDPCNSRTVAVEAVLLLSDAVADISAYRAVLVTIRPFVTAQAAIANIDEVLS